MKKYMLLFILSWPLVLSAKGQAYEAVFNRIDEAYTINDDGSSEYRYRKVLKLNTHLAFNNLYGETFIVYNPAYQTLKINEAYTKQADGTIVRTPDNAFNPSLPRFASDAPAYNRLTEMIVTHTGLELGCTIYLDYTISTKTGYLAATDFYRSFNDHSPIEEYQLSITAPSDLFYRQTVKPGVEPQRNGRTYMWKFKNIPAVFPESNIASNTIPFFFASTERSDEARAKAIGDMIAEAARGTVDNYVGKTKFCGIAKYVGKQVDNSRVPLYLANRIRTPQDVADSAYGTAAEKAALFASLLKTTGTEGSIVCTFPKNVSPSLLTLSNIYIKSGNKLISPVDGSENETSRLSYHNQLWVDGNRLKIDLVPEQVTYAVEKDLNTEEAGLSQSGDYLVYTLPVPDKGFDTWRIKTLNTERRQTYEIPTMLDETCEYTLVLPEGRTLATKPYDRTIRNKVGEVRLQLVREENKVKIARHIRLNEYLIPTSYYAAFRSLANLWNNPAYRSVILR